MAVSPAASSAGLPVSVVVPAGAEAFRQRIRGFIAGSVIPVEQEAFVRASMTRCGSGCRTRRGPRACWLRRRPRSSAGAAPTS